MQPSLFANHGAGTGRTDDAQTLADLEVDYTPVAVALQLTLTLDKLMREMLFWPPSLMLDPSAGSGCWGRVARAVFGDSTELVGVEPRESELGNIEDVYDGAHCATFNDYLASPTFQSRRFGLVLTNPPFSAFEPETFWPVAIRRAGLLTSGAVVAIYGLSQWGQSEGAQKSMREWSPSLQLRLGGRVAHRGNGQADAREYSLWVWTHKPTPFRWETIQLPSLPAVLRRWSPSSVPGTFEIDPALVAEVAGYLP